MIPTLFFYELVLVALVWLFLMLYWLWPNDSVILCSTLPTLRPPQRKRSREPNAFAGLSQKPPCAACEHDATHPQPPVLRNNSILIALDDNLRSKDNSQ